MSDYVHGVGSERQESHGHEPERRNEMSPERDGLVSFVELFDRDRLGLMSCAGPACVNPLRASVGLYVLAGQWYG
jgi:hypothetical protein